MLTGGKRYVGCRVVGRSLDGPVPVQQHFCNTLLDALFLGAHDGPLKVNSRRDGVPVGVTVGRGGKDASLGGIFHALPI